MKKILSIAVAAVCGLSVVSVCAQQPVLKTEGNIYICPSLYIDREGEGSCLLSSINEEGLQAKIYNAALTEIRQISLKGRPQLIEALEGDAQYEFMFTQYLFNDDDKFEYLAETEDSHKVEIVNESGDKLGEFDFGGMWCKVMRLIHLSSEYKYLVFNLYDEDSYSQQEWIYSVNQLTGNVQKVAENVMGLIVRPTVTDGSLPVEIALGKSASADLGVAVVAANGSEAMSETIKAGESGISLNVRNLAKGVYVVNVAGCESSKFIIR